MTQVYESDQGACQTSLAMLIPCRRIFRCFSSSALEVPRQAGHIASILSLVTTFIYKCT